MVIAPLGLIQRKLIEKGFKDWLPGRQNESKEREKEKRKTQCLRMNTLNGESLRTELKLEAYRTLYPQYIPASSLGLEDETISRGIP